MYLCEPAARHSVAWEEKAQWLSYSLQKRVENQPVSALCRTCSSSPQLLLCAVSLQLPAVLQVAAPACCHVGLITTHHLLGPSLNLAQRKQPTAAGRQTGNQQAGGEAESTVSAPADQCKGTSRRNPHSWSCPQHTHTQGGSCACICSQHCSGCSCFGAVDSLSVLAATHAADAPELLHRVGQGHQVQHLTKAAAPEVTCTRSDSQQQTQTLIAQQAVCSETRSTRHTARQSRAASPCHAFTCEPPFPHLTVLPR